MRVNVIYNVFYQIIYIGTQLFITSYTSQVLGASGVGEYTLVNAYANYAILFAKLGMDRYASREIAYYKDDKKRISKLFREILCLRGITFSIVGFAYFVLFFVFQIDNANSIKISLIMILSYAIDISWLYMGIEDMKAIVLKNCIVRVVSVLLIGCFIKNEYQVTECIVIMMGTVALGNILLWVNIPVFIKKIKVKANIKDIIYHLKESFKLFIPEVAIQVYVVLDKVILGNISGEYQLGLYEASYKMVDITRVIQAAVIATTPTLAYYISCDKEEEFKNIAEHTFQLANFIAIPACAGIMGVAYNLVPWFFGKDFFSVVNMMYLSALFILTKSWSSVLGDQILMVTKLQKYYTRGVVAGAVLDIVLNFILVYKYQAVGVLIASIIAEYVGMFIMLIAVKRKLGFSITKLYCGTVKYILCAGIMGFIIHKIGLLFSSSILTTFLQIVCGITIYILELLLLRDKLLKNIFNNVKNSIHKIFHS